MNEFNRTRAKILGVLIRDARLHAGRTEEDCANVLGISREKFAQAELGESILSLPHLETLSMYLDLPLNHFWGDKALGQHKQTDFDGVMQSRHRQIGATLKDAREKEKRSLQDLAQELGLTPKRLEAFEAGEEPIPLFQLDRAARYLGYSLNHFMDLNEASLLGKHEAIQKIRQRFQNLTPEMQAFVTEPINISYLEIAKRLSEMDVKALRTVAENILNITF